MSEFEFRGTPGPWMVSDQSPLIIKKDYREIGSNSGFLIGSSMGNDNSAFYATEKEATANARAIAAVPELIAVAQSALLYAEDMGNDFLSRQARAALTKATGGNTDD